MKKTILIPTDFSVKSLTLVKEALNSNQEIDVNIVLVHGIEAPDSISELLFFSKRKLISSLETQEFKSSCKLLQNKYGTQINSFCLDVFTGKNQAAFENYLEGNKIDEAYVPKGYKLKKKHKRSFDITSYFQKSNIQVHEVDIQATPQHQEQESDQVAELFFTHSQTAQ